MLVGESEPVEGVTVREYQINNIPFASHRTMGLKARFDSHKRCVRGVLWVYYFPAKPYWLKRVKINFNLLVFLTLVKNLQGFQNLEGFASTIFSGRTLTLKVSKTLKVSAQSIVCTFFCRVDKGLFLPTI